MSSGRALLPPPVYGNCTVEVISSEESFLGLKQKWCRLLDVTRNASVFADFDWVLGWWRHIGSKDAYLGPKRLSVLAVRQGGKITCLAPLMVRTVSRRSLAIRKVEFIGSTFHDYNDLLGEGKAGGQIAAVVAELAAQQASWDVVDLRSIPAESKTPGLFAKALASSDLHWRVRPDDPCPYVPIQTDWSGFLETLSRGSRSTLRKQANRLKRLETEGWRIRLIENPQDERDLLERMIQVEARKLVHGSPGNRFLGDVREFFGFVFQALGAAGRLYVAVLEKPGELVAYQMGFRCADKLWGYTKAFDPAHARYSPGTMLVPAVFDYGFQKGYREYDFLRGDEAYKKRWTTDAHRTVRIQVWKREWRSRITARLYFDLRPLVYRSRWLSALGFPYVPEGEV
jgi:CelD/BcsL family acetyltransferase involved in cellulose biosynthesis